MNDLNDLNDLDLGLYYECEKYPNLYQLEPPLKVVKENSTNLRPFKTTYCTFWLRVDPVDPFAPMPKWKRRMLEREPVEEIDSSDSE